MLEKAIRAKRERERKEKEEEKKEGENRRKGERRKKKGHRIGKGGKTLHFLETVLLPILKAQIIYREIDILKWSKDHYGSSRVGVWVTHTEKMKMDSYFTPTHKK